VDARQERLARNEALFREVNERISELAESHGSDLHVYEFLCECSNADCTFRLALPLARYEAVRSHGARFVIRPDHFLPEIERVVERGEGYWVVEKGGEAAELVEELDPRAGAD